MSLISPIIVCQMTPNKEGYFVNNRRKYICNRCSKLEIWGVVVTDKIC